jgi:hypothetical protein
LASVSLADFSGTRRKGPRCTFPQVLAACPPDVRKLAEQAMAADPQVYPGSKIADVLSATSGRKIGDYTVNRHRNGKCSCAT